MTLSEKLLEIAEDIVRLEDELARRRGDFYRLAGEPYVPNLRLRIRSTKPTTLTTRILRLFADHSALRAEDVIRHFPDYSAAVVYATLSRLRKEGVLVRPRHGVYMVAPGRALSYAPAHEPPGRAAEGRDEPVSAGGAADEAEHARGALPDVSNPGHPPSGA